MGTADPDVKEPALEAKCVATALHAPVHMIEGAGHYPHAEMPGQVALVLADLATIFVLQNRETTG